MNKAHTNDSEDDLMMAILNQPEHALQKEMQGNKRLRPQFISKSKNSQHFTV